MLPKTASVHLVTKEPLNQQPVRFKNAKRVRSAQRVQHAAASVSRPERLMKPRSSMSFIRG
jgi:hypothetical protein